MSQFLFRLVAALFLVLVATPAYAGKPPPEWKCARELRDAQAASPMQVCRIAGPSRFTTTRYGWQEEICNIRCEIIDTPLTYSPTSPPVRPTPPPPQVVIVSAPALQEQIDLRRGTQAVERIARDTAATRAAVEALAARLDRIDVQREAARLAPARSRTTTSTATPTTPTTTSASSAVSRKELEEAWAACQSMGEELRINPLNYLSYRRCAVIGAELGVH